MIQGANHFQYSLYVVSTQKPQCNIPFLRLLFIPAVNPSRTTAIKTQAAPHFLPTSESFAASGPVKQTCDLNARAHAISASPAPAYLSAIPKQHLQPCCFSPSHRPAVPSGLAPRGNILFLGTSTNNYELSRTYTNSTSNAASFNTCGTCPGKNWPQMPQPNAWYRMVSADSHCLCCLKQGFSSRLAH